ALFVEGTRRRLAAVRANEELPGAAARGLRVARRKRRKGLPPQCLLARRRRADDAVTFVYKGHRGALRPHAHAPSELLDGGGDDKGPDAAAVVVSEPNRPGEIRGGSEEAGRVEIQTHGAESVLLGVRALPQHHFMIAQLQQHLLGARLVLERLRDGA